MQKVGFALRIRRRVGAVRGSQVHSLPKRLTGFINVPGGSRERHALRMIVQKSQLLLETVGIRQIVAILPGDDRGTAGREPHIQRIDNARVLLVDHQQAVIRARQALHNLPCCVGRAIIDNDDPDIADGLRLDAGNRALDRFFPVNSPLTKSVVV